MTLDVKNYKFQSEGSVCSCTIITVEMWKCVLFDTVDSYYVFMYVKNEFT